MEDINLQMNNKDEKRHDEAIYMSTIPNPKFVSTAEDSPQNFIKEARSFGGKI